MNSRILGLCASAGLLAAPVGAQSFLHDISLSGLGNGNPARPFGISVEPVSGQLYVGVAGDLFGGANNVVAIVDPVTDTVTGTITVGLFPEDVAFVYDSGGGVRYGAVTNSSSGSVTLWDAGNQVVATVALPDPLGFGTCYPFGVTPAEDGARLYVSTVDGSGDVHAVDLASLSYDAAESINLGPKTGGRMLHRGNMLFVPTTGFDATFSGSEGGLTGWSTGALPFFWERVFVNHAGQFQYPGGSDLVILADGRLVLGGVFFDNRLYLVEPGGEIVRSLRLSGFSGSAHGLALSPDGKLLAVCDLAGNDLVLVDMVNFKELSVTHLGSVGQGYSQPNDAVFLGGKLYVTCQGNEEVVVFDNLPVVTPGPGYGGSISVSESAPSAGGNVLVTVSGSGLVLLLRSSDDVPAVLQGVALDIGPAPSLAGSGTGGFSASFRVPATAPRGLHHFFQGVVDAKHARTPTEPRVVIVQ